jgi:serine/threonine protein kinase
MGAKKGIIMRLCGPTLKQIFDKYKKIAQPGDKINLTSIVISKVAIKCLHLLERIHSVGLIHNDLKPDNICISS